MGHLGLLDGTDLHFYSILPEPDFKYKANALHGMSDLTGIYGAQK